jgi:hypothetical protein
MWVGVCFSATEKEPKGFLWPRRKLKSVRIRVAIVRRRRATSIAVRTARVPRIVRLSRATAAMWSALPARRRVRRVKRSGFQIYGTVGGPDVRLIVGLILGVAGRMLFGNCKRRRGVSMAEKKIEKCAHPGCNGPAAQGSKYCGAYCEGSANRPSIASNCRHAECAAGETVSATG